MYEVFYLVGCMQVDIAAKKPFCYFDTSILYSQHERSRSIDLQVEKVCDHDIHISCIILQWGPEIPFYKRPFETSK